MSVELPKAGEFPIETILVEVPTPEQPERPIWDLKEPMPIIRNGDHVSPIMYLKDENCTPRELLRRKIFTALENDFEWGEIAEFMKSLGL